MIKISSGNAATDLGFMHEMRMQGWTRKQASVMYDYALHFNSSDQMEKSASVFGVPDNPETNPLSYLQWQASAAERYAWCNDSMYKAASVGDQISQGGGQMWDGMKQMGNGAYNVLSGIGQGFANVPRYAARGLGYYGGMVRNTFDEMQRMPGELQRMKEERWNQAKDWMSDKWSQGKDWANDKYNQAKDWANEKYNQASDWANDKYNQAKGWANEKYDQAKGWANEKYNQAKEGLNTAGNWIKDKANQAWEGAKSTINTAYNKGKDMAKSVGGFFSRAWNWGANKVKDAGNWVKDKANQAWEGAKSMAGAAYDKGKEYVQGLGDEMRSGYEAARGGAGGGAPQGGGLGGPQFQQR